MSLHMMICGHELQPASQELAYFMYTQADVLLELHNTHHYNMFMHQVRQAILEGRFQQYKAWFQSISGAAMTGEDHVEVPDRASLKRSFVSVIDKEAASRDYKRAHQAFQ